VTALAGKVALVTGASRGVGKGIALALGDAGATVYVTGRSVAGGEPTTSLAGTIDETAAEVSARGGNGIAVRCDHTRDDEVRDLFASIEREAGHLDVLVNNAWGGYELFHEGRGQEFESPFWEQDLSIWDGMFTPGVRGQYVSTVFAVPLMLGRGGLIVNTSSFAGASPKDNPALGTAKAATDRLTRLTAEHLRDHAIAVVSLYPGLVRTEGILKWEDYIDLSNSESPLFVGRAVVALATDPNVLERTGTVQVVAEVAGEYGFTDEDGSRPRSLRPQFEEVS
jgi:NAD(P)-dependent dehydrogenase (short-subunit alcohol dehydrogenase family)